MFICNQWLYSNLSGISLSYNDFKHIIFRLYSNVVGQKHAKILTTIYVCVFYEKLNVSIPKEFSIKCYSYRSGKSLGNSWPYLVALRLKGIGKIIMHKIFQKETLLETQGAYGTHYEVMNKNNMSP